MSKRKIIVTTETEIETDGIYCDEDCWFLGWDEYDNEICRLFNSTTLCSETVIELSCKHCGTVRSYRAKQRCAECLKHSPAGEK